MYSEEKQSREVFDKIYSSFRVYYILMMIVTNTPVFIAIQNHNLRTKLRRTVHYSRLITLCIVFYRIAQAVFFHPHANKHFSMLNIGLLLLILIPSVLLGLAGALRDYYDAFLNYLKRLSETDLMLKLNGFHLDESVYVISIRRNKFVLYYLVTIYSITTITAGYAIDFGYFGAILIGGGLGAKALFQFMIASKLFDTKKRFEIINGAIDDLIIQKSMQNCDMTSDLNCEKVITDRLYICCRIHYRLCSILREGLNEVQLLLFLSISSTIFTMFYSIFNIYYLITDSNTSITLMHRSSWVIVQLLELFVFVSACAQTCDSANQTPMLLHRLRNVASDMNIENHLVGNMVTYLTLLIQFELPVELERNEKNFTYTD